MTKVFTVTFIFVYYLKSATWTPESSAFSSSVGLLTEIMWDCIKDSLQYKLKFSAKRNLMWQALKVFIWEV